MPNWHQIVQLRATTLLLSEWWRSARIDQLFYNRHLRSGRLQSTLLTPLADYYYASSTQSHPSTYRMVPVGLPPVSLPDGLSAFSQCSTCGGS